MRVNDVSAKLANLGIPEFVLADLPEIPSSAEALLIYGSRSRGDALDDSDLDLLALVPKQIPAINSGFVNISFYTAGQLKTGISSLFGAHLQRDAIIVSDETGELRRLISEMGEVDTVRLLKRVRAMCELFSTPERDLPQYLPGLLREARYLLRSSLYALAIADGSPCFSVRELSARHGDPTLANLLASRQSEAPSMMDYEQCLERLRQLIGAFPPSRHGSLEATVVNEWGTHSDLMSMAFMALGSAGGGSDYSEVEKILL